MAAPGLNSLAGRSGFLDDLRSLGAVTPHAVALIEPGHENLTFSGLQHRIGTVARAVTAAGLTRDDVVALILPDSAELLTSFLGVASVATCAVVSPALHETEVEAMLDALETRALIVNSTGSSSAGDLARKRGVAVLHITDLAECSEHDLSESASRDDVALLLHTSATTGKARIVPLTHSNPRAMAGHTRGILGLTSADRFLNVMPLFHLQGLLSSLAQLLAGGSVICTPAFDAGAFLSWLEDDQPTWYTARPTLHHAILPLIASHPDTLKRSRLRFVRSIGAPLKAALMEDIERTLHVPVLEGYGLTEAGAITSNAPPPQRRKAGSTGRSAGSEIGIMSAAGELQPPNWEDEIVVRRPAVMHSYLNNPEADRNAFRDGWFRTGDLGRLDAEGFLFVTGRIKEMINRGGEKILPGEIEDSLLTHPAVAKAVAFGVAHPTLGEDVMAVVVPRPQTLVSESELRRFLGERIAEFKLPRRVIFLDASPKGATGKPLRADLAIQLGPEIDVIPDGAGASTEVETRLVAMWRRILKIESLGTRDDFFRLGGDSLALTDLMSELDLEFGPEDREEFLIEPDNPNAGADRDAFALPAKRSIFLGRTPAAWLSHPPFLHSERGRESIRFSGTDQGTRPESTGLHCSRPAVAYGSRTVHGGGPRRAFSRGDLLDLSEGSLSSGRALLRWNRGV
jgi:acyl-CoA synthetase (AMP-forming)/AMP-acid ligase II